MDALHHKFVEYLSRAVSRRRYRIPQHRGDLVSLLHAEAKVLDTSYEGNNVFLEVLLSRELEGRLEGDREIVPA